VIFLQSDRPGIARSMLGDWLGVRVEAAVGLVGTGSSGMFDKRHVVWMGLGMLMFCQAAIKWVKTYKKVGFWKSFRFEVTGRARVLRELRFRKMEPWTCPSLRVTWSFVPWLFSGQASEPSLRLRHKFVIFFCTM
jgi:hypothetical protein